MSVYADFMIKDKETGRYLPLMDINRSSVIYEYIEDYLVWEKVIPVTDKLLNEIVNTLKAEDDKYREYINDALARKEFIFKLNNSVEEKMDAYCDVERTIADYNDLREGVQRAIAFYQFLWWIVNDNGDGYVYAGLEVSAEWLNKQNAVAAE